MKYCRDSIELIRLQGLDNKVVLLITEDWLYAVEADEKTLILSTDPFPKILEAKKHE